MERQFKRILDLVRRTGDRMVVTDPNGDDAYVIMGLDQYEELISAATHEHCEEEETDEIDWNPEMYGDLVPNEPEFEPRGDELGKTPTAEQEKTSEDLPEELKAAVEHDLAILESWRKEQEGKPTEQTKAQKNSEGEQKNDDEEDRFYLEPID